MTTIPDADGGDAIVTLDGVRFAYGGGPFALEIDDLRLRRGVHAACIGPSGCGKTTLINLIAGILAPQRGTVWFAGHTMSAMSDAERRATRLRHIGMVFQEFALLPYLTALENILLPYHVGDLDLDRDARARAKSLAEATGIAHTLRRLPHRLSQGERQRIAICRALVTAPELIICDEPTGNLDPTLTGRTIDLLVSQASERNATLLVVTHDHGLLDRFDHVVDLGVATPAGGTSA